jgi:hypothetical protein
MLVPNPSEDFRARIGDRDAEEISDLSDCSDGALEDIVLAGVETEPTDIHVPEVRHTLCLSVEPQKCCNESHNSWWGAIWTLNELYPVLCHMNIV